MNAFNVCFQNFCADDPDLALAAQEGLIESDDDIEEDIRKLLDKSVLYPFWFDELDSSIVVDWIYGRIKALDKNKKVLKTYTFQEWQAPGTSPQRG